MIDSSFPFVISELLKYYYKRECNSSMEDMMQHIEHINPCGFDTTNTHPFYRYKMKNFLVDVALGMKPNEIWHGIYDANGGYIVVKKRWRTSLLSCL
ncbi:HpaII family restriction endonuclease [Bacillus paranthracis]